MTTTRAATFSAKIRTLTEFHIRIASNQQAPSNAEIVTTLRYFHQTLIGFLKDVPAENSHLFMKFNVDAQHSTFFPNLNYSGLFYGIVNLLDALPLITSGQLAIGEAILDTLKGLYFFLDKDCIDQMPYLIASQLGILPAELNRKLIHLLCNCILPYSLSEHTFDDLSIPAILMLILQHSPDPSLHTMIIENLMSIRLNVYNDVLEVIAKGTSESRIPAANLLFHYWPLMNPIIIHRKIIQYRVQAWSQINCQNTFCNEKALSIKKSYDPVICAKLGDTAPPINLCQECAENLESDEPVYFLCQPMPSTNSTVCQNKACESSNRMAVGTCFSEDCIRSHNHIPLRLCQECFTVLHAHEGNSSGLNIQPHIRHSGMSLAWSTPIERNMVEAIVKLLKETYCQLEGSEGESKRPKWLRQLEGGQALGKDFDAMSDERRMLSRFGVWMMAALCPPIPEAPKEAIGYIMSMVFQWFSTTALLPNDSMGSAIEQLKVDFASDWVNLAITNHYEILLTILLPNLPEYAQVAGIWDKWGTKKDQMKEGLTKLLSLMPYDIISYETWNKVIPHWLQAISQEIDEADLMELKVLLCKIFEPDLCPLPFEQEKVFEFISSRLTSGDYVETFKALDWLHLLSRMNIKIVLSLLLDLLMECLNKIHQIKIPLPNEENDLEDNNGPLGIEVIIVDIIAQQTNLNDVSFHISHSISDQMFATAALILHYNSENIHHTCQNPDTDQFSDCLPCQQSGFIYQVLMHLIEQLCPKDEVKIEVDMTKLNDWLNDAQMTDSLATPLPSNLPSPRNPSIQGMSPSLPPNFNDPIPINGKQQQKTSINSSSLHPYNSTAFPFVAQANLNEDFTKDEYVAAIPSEEIETAQAQATTITETDMGHETCQIVTATLCETLRNTPTQANAAALMATAKKAEFWDTSVGRFRFSLEQLPAQLKLIYSLLINIDRELDPDVQYFLLTTLKYLCLHCEALSNARREFRGFLIWIQENLLIPKLWTLLRSDYSQVGQLAVPLLIHAISLPCGEEVFWNTVNREFTSNKWQIRFKAVERVYVLAHMIVAAPIKANRLLQTCLSCAFSHLIVSTHDPNLAVAQRTILALKAMPSTSLSLICLCLESQFDSCILDRPLIINRISLLSSVVPDESILTWDFFIQRFETMALEAQLKSQAGDNNFVQDLLHTDPMSELYQRKITKARQSLNETESVRSIVKSLRENSLKHQLTMNSKIDKEQRQLAQDVQRNRARRGATCSANTCRVKLQKVLMMVRVVNAFRTITDRLSVFSPISAIRSSTTSRTNSTEFGQQSTKPMTLRAPIGGCSMNSQTPSAFTLAGVNAMGETASIAAAAAVSANAAGFATPTQSTQASLSWNIVDDSHSNKNPTPKNAAANTLNYGISGAGDYSGKYQRLREFTDEESNLCLLLNRVVDIENPERHTLYLTVALFVRFLCSKKCVATDEKTNMKKQSVLLRHFNTLLGYSNSEKCFTIPAKRLRKSVVCNAFLNGLPEILDNNLMIANQMLPIIMQLLLHLPSSQKFASDHSIANYSLSLIDQTTRHSWLYTLILILYKYRCDAISTSENVRKLILIVIVTLECHCHVCCNITNLTEYQTTTTIDGQISGNSDEKSANSEFRPIEYEIWTDTSNDESESKEELIEEEEEFINQELLSKNPTTGENLMKRGQLPRPDSLGVIASKNTYSNDTQQIIITKEVKMLQPTIIEPQKSSTTTENSTTLPKISWRIKQQRQKRGNTTSNNNKKLRKLRAEYQRLCCGYCNEKLETFDEETISLCLISLETFLHREPAMAAPLLFRIINTVTRLIDSPQFPWHDLNIFVPGNSKSTGKQLIRVILHQLSSSCIAIQLFDSKIENIKHFWSIIAFSLAEFNELNPIAFLQCLLEDIMENWPQRLARILHNLAAYIIAIPIDIYLNNWSNVINLLDNFFRRYYSQTINENNNSTNRIPTIRSEVSNTIIIICTISKIQNFSTFKASVGLMESYSKWLAEILHQCNVELKDLLMICTACNRALIRERDKQCITRAIVMELIQAIKFKCELAERNYMTIVYLILQDFGEEIPNQILENSIKSNKYYLLEMDQFNTGASEAIRPYMNEILEFISDLHILSKLKKQTNSDRIGGDLKAALSEVVALEMNCLNRPNIRDSRTVMRFIPWLYSPPNLTSAAPGAFAESVTNVRVLSWLLLGALHAKQGCLPVPISCSNHMADYIHFVLAGFADQSKQSVVHMSALFHAFHLCQLWTIYCEKTQNQNDETVAKAMGNILDFWARVTPAILQLLSHSKVLADMVNLHFVNTMQALQQCNSAVLCQLYPMWQPILTAYHAQIPSQLRIKLNACENQPPLDAQPIFMWLKKVRYKISQIELQTSAASPFYNV